jgi:hypothetical protein
LSTPRCLHHIPPPVWSYSDRLLGDGHG